MVPLFPPCMCFLITLLVLFSYPAEASTDSPPPTCFPDSRCLAPCVRQPASTGQAAGALVPAQPAGTQHVRVGAIQTSPGAESRSPGAPEPRSAESYGEAQGSGHPGQALCVFFRKRPQKDGSSQRTVETEFLLEKSRLP